MRVCVVGAGLAGSVLAWRLAQTTPAGTVDVLIGAHRAVDATAASGGVVRAYEPYPPQRRLALESLRELTDSPVLRSWSGFRPLEFVYLRPTDAEVAPALAEIEHQLPGAVELLDRAQTGRLGFADLPDAAVAVRERWAGYLSPDRLRRSVLSDAAGRGVEVVAGAATGVRFPRPGVVACQVGDRTREYDRVVLAAGGWTAAILAASGLPHRDYRTKSIQYSIYRTGDWRPPQFADEFTGLYGRPDPDGFLLGLPTELWQAPVDRPSVSPDLHRRARRLAERRLPNLQIGSLVRTVGAVDCYHPDPVLSLRPVPGTDQRLFTFTGGAGGAVKTVLAASRLAAHHLISSGIPPGRGAPPGGHPAPLPVGPQRGLS